MCVQKETCSIHKDFYRLNVSFHLVSLICFLQKSWINIITLFISNLKHLLDIFKNVCPVVQFNIFLNAHFNQNPYLFLQADWCL